MEERMEEKKYKKLIPSFGCLNGQAIIRDQKEEFYSNDMKTLGRYYSDNGADELLIRDLSKTDEEHEKTIGSIKEVARTVDIPVIAGGRVKRLEDVKKYLYAGAKAVFLDAASEENIDILKEASDRFGREKLYVRISDLSQLKRAEEFAQLGASMLIIDHEETLTTSQMEEIEKNSLPAILFCDDDTIGAITSYLKLKQAAGVLLTVPYEESGNCMLIKQELKKRGIEVDTFESSVEWKQFKTNADGLIPVIVQDYRTSEVLMLAYMNEEAFQTTLRSGKMTYFSRSRQSLWIKGETSGHFQYVKSLQLDCDNDTLLAKVSQIGAACHTGARSCFFQTLAKKEMKESNPLKVFEDVYQVILDRKEHPKEGSYTNYLFDKGIDKILKKLGEEATEIVIAAKNPNPEETKYEIADFLYHAMVLMAVKGLTWEDITEELADR